MDSSWESLLLDKRSQSEELPCAAINDQKGERLLYAGSIFTVLSVLSRIS
jgi:hypothetical protein